MDVDNFEVETLLTEIEKRPCLWDRHSEAYKSKLERKIAWNEIGSALFSDFEEWSEQEKQSMGLKLASKWRNLRDYYVKINKRNGSKSGSGSRKKMTYLYACHLGFLSKLSDANGGDEEEEDAASTLDETDEPSPKQRAGKRRLIVDLRRNMRLHQKQPAPPAVNPDTEHPPDDLLADDPADDDRAFFESLLPSLKPLATDEKLDLRLEVIQLIKKARQSHFAKYQTSGQNRGHSVGRNARNSFAEASS